jgi:hypothetical protein
MSFGHPKSSFRVAISLLTVIALLVPMTAIAARHASQRHGARSLAGTRDTTPPTVSVGEPTSGATLSGIARLSGIASDDREVWKIRYRVFGNGRYQRAEGTTSWTALIDTTGLADGPYVIDVRALDVAKNATVVEVPVSVVNAVPTPTPTPTTSPTPSPTPTPSLPPPHGGPGTVWGVYSDSRGALGSQDMITWLEDQVGRTFGGQRLYTNMDLNLPMSIDKSMQQQGKLDYHNVNSWTLDGAGNKICYSWSDIAAGRYDEWWTRQALSLKAWGYPVLLSFTHEPSVDSVNHPQCGTPSDYRNAYDHVWKIFNDQDVTNVSWVWTLTASTFNGANGGPAVWEPTHYDYVGVDGYNHADRWRSPNEIFQTSQDFAVLRGKPLLIGEIGCDEMPGNAQAKADWLTEAAELFESYGDVAAIMWTNTGNGGDYWLDSSAQAFAAFALAGRGASFG